MTITAAAPITMPAMAPGGKLERCAGAGVVVVDVLGREDAEVVDDVDDADDVVTAVLEGLESVFRTMN